jgi:phosphoacetylglucosamine mutase
LDGDKITALYSKFILDQIKEAGLDELRVGVVQTAYANGASTQYLAKKLGIKVACTNTGVKFLHKQVMF